jgi:Tol biopolymer transport system component/DNA-binding winged helix-turn-helix (wHTH) protein
MLKFGPYVVDLTAGEVRKNGSRIRLQEKPLRVLALLAERQGQLVTREELKNRLWPEETFVDFEAGLNTAVSKLRDALSDRTDKPRYIETIPRRGYRFLTSVEIVGSGEHYRVAPAAAVPAGELGSTTENGSAVVALPFAEDQIAQIRSTHAAWIRGTIAGAALLLIFTVWWLTPLPDPRVTDIFSVTQSGLLDYVVRPATDGARLFYVQRAGDHYNLMQTPANGGEAQKVDAPFPNTLVWDVSPDRSKYLITSFAGRGEPAPLWSWPATGGPPVKIGDVVSGSATFSPDGKQIVYHLGNDLLIANSDGSAIRKLASFAEEPDSPVWSPDGRKIRFNRNDPERDTGSIWEISPDGNNLHPVLPHWPAHQYGGTWTPDGRYFLFVDSNMPVSRLYALREEHEWWRRSPQGPFLLAAEATGSWSPLVSLDGRSVYFYGRNLQSDLEALDPATQKFSPVMREKHAAMLSVSRDGEWVAYIDQHPGALWTSRFDGSGARKIELPGVRGAFPRFSPDNKLIAFTALREGLPPTVYLVSSDGGTPRPLIPEAGGRITDPDWSPDGTRVVVDRDAPISQRQQSSSMLAFVDLKTAKITDLAGSEELRMPRWSPDGRYLVAVRDTRTEIRMFDVESQRWSTIAQGKSIGFPVWSADGASLYFQDVLAPGEPLYRVQIAKGAQTQVASFQSAIDAGIGRCVLVALSPQGAPIIEFDHNHSDIYGAHLLLP